MENYKEFISGGLSGVVEVTTTHWIDNLKTRFQESRLGNKKLTFEAINIKNLYWGFYPRLIGIVPMRTVFWSTQKLSNEYLEKYKIDKNIKYIGAGVFSGSMQTLVDNPIEAFKVNLITNNNKLTKVNIFAGFVPTIIRNSLFCGIFNLVVSNRKDDHKLISGAIGGVAASLLSHPFDVLKTEMQKANSETKNSFTFVKNNLKNPTVFLSGIVPRAVLSIATMSVGYFSFNLFLSII